MNRKTLSLAVALAFTAGFLWLASRNVRFSALGPILAQARWEWLLGMCAIAGVVDLYIRARRWNILLAQAAPASLGTFFQLEAIGIAVNNVLFARLGELLRAVLAARQLRVPVATALSSIVVERTLDVSALLTIFVIASAFHHELISAPIRHATMILLAGVILALVFLVLAEETLEPGGMLERRLRSWPKAHEMVAHLAAGAAVLRRPRALLPVVGWSLLLWLIDAAVYWFGARALGLEGYIDYSRSILVLSWAGAGSALPAVPGALGTFEAMVKTIVEKMGASAPEAFAYALFVHMTMYILVTVIGLVFLYRVGLSLGGIKGSLDQGMAKDRMA